jgi:stage III sporulation protein AB
MISCIGLGFDMSGKLGRRRRMLEMILRMIILLRGEIRYGNKSLYDAFTGASGKLEGKYREFFILTAQEMKRNAGISFGEIFRECAEKCLNLDCLSQEEREQFCSLGDRLGYLGLEMQLKQLDQLEKETEYAIRELEKDFREKRKLYRSMGILGGIFAVVLFW